MPKRKPADSDSDYVDDDDTVPIPRAPSSRGRSSSRRTQKTSRAASPSRDEDDDNDEEDASDVEESSEEPITKPQRKRSSASKAVKATPAKATPAKRRDGAAAAAGDAPLSSGRLRKETKRDDDFVDPTVVQLGWDDEDDEDDEDEDEDDSDVEFDEDDDSEEEEDDVKDDSDEERSAAPKAAGSKPAGSKATGSQPASSVPKVMTIQAALKLHGANGLGKLTDPQCRELLEQYELPTSGAQSVLIPRIQELLVEFAKAKPPLKAELKQRGATSDEIKAASEEGKEALLKLLFHLRKHKRTVPKAAAKQKINAKEKAAKLEKKAADLRSKLRAAKKTARDGDKELQKLQKEVDKAKNKQGRYQMELYATEQKLKGKGPKPPPAAAAAADGSTPQVAAAASSAPTPTPDPLSWHALADGIETPKKLEKFFVERQSTPGATGPKLRIKPGSAVKIDNEALKEKFIKFSSGKLELNDQVLHNPPPLPASAPPMPLAGGFGFGGGFGGGGFGGGFAQMIPDYGCNIDSFLFHGSNEHNMGNIHSEGLKSTMPAAHGTMLGKGVYGAPDPRKSHQYCTGTHGNFMIVCRFFLKQAKFKTNQFFDEFCVPDEAMCVPLWQVKVELDL